MKGRWFCQDSLKVGKNALFSTGVEQVVHMKHIFRSGLTTSITFLDELSENWDKKGVIISMDIESE